MRKRFVLPAVVAGLLTGAIAFAEGEVEQAGEKTITFWHHTYTVATDWMREQAATYLEDHPGLQIDIIEYPHGDYEVRLRAAIAAGDPPDILNVLDYLFPEFHEKGWLAPVDPGAFGVSTQQEVVDLFVHPALEGMVFDGQVYGVPAEFNTFVLFLNREMFAEAGLDASALSAQWQERAVTWDRFFDLLSSVERRGADGSIERIGFNWVWGLDSFWYAQQFWNVTTQYGCRIIDDANRVAVDSPACVRAFEETWYRLIREGRGGPDIATASPVYAFQDFMEERQAVVMGGPWAPAAWRENSPNVFDNFVVAPIPQRDPDDPQTFIHTYALAVSADSDAASESWDFLDALLSTPGEMYEVAGYINGRRGMFQLPQVRNALRGVEVYEQSYATGSFVWRSPTWAQEGELLKNAVEEFAESGDVAGALSRAAAEMRRLRNE